MSKVLFVGLDVHAETIAVAVAETGGEVRSMGVIPNRLESIRKLVHKLGPVQHLRACYEAGPTGYVLYWQLTQLGVACEVIAPSLVPTKAGDRVKTDRRDAEKLARCYRAGELTAVWVPDAAHEALRDLVRALDEAVRQAPPEIRVVIEALQALRGVAQTTAATIVCELGSLSRFQSPRQLMGYSGLVASEHSSGNRVRRGGITKTGNGHLRRVLVEAAWAYQHRPNVIGFLLRRQKTLAISDEAKRIAWKAQQRLHKRYKAMAARGKNKNQIVTAIGRELVGFIGAIAVETEKQPKLAKSA